MNVDICSVAVINLQSEDAKKQISALDGVLSMVRGNSPLSEDLLLAIIERGLGSEVTVIRSLSFKCMKLLYKTQSTSKHWNEIRAAIVAEMGTAEEVHSLSSAFSVFDVISDYDLVNFFSSKDGLSVIKSCLVHQVPQIRIISVRYLGRVLLRLWCLLDEIDIEGQISVESSSEARQTKEIMKDLILESFKMFALGLIGKAPTSEPGQIFEDTQSAYDAYCDIIGILLLKYNQYENIAQKWMKAITGNLSGYESLNLSTDTSNQRKTKFEQLIKQFFVTISINPWTLFARWNSNFPTLSGAKILSQFVWFLLQQQPISMSVTNLFSLDTSKNIQNILFNYQEDSRINDTLDSCIVPVPTAITQLAEEWFSTLVTFLPTVTSLKDLLDLIEVLLSALLQNDQLVHLKFKIFPQLLDQLLRLLFISNSPAHVTAAGSRTVSGALEEENPKTEQVLAYALLALRSCPAKILATSSMSVLAWLDNATIDDVTRARLCTELSWLILTTPTSIAGGEATLLQGVVSQAEVAHPSLLQAFLHTISDRLSDANSSWTRVRLVTALLRCVTSLLPVVVHAAVIESTSTNDISSEGGGSKLGDASGLGYYSLVSEALKDAGFPLPNTLSVPTLASRQVQLEYLLACVYLLLTKLSRCLKWPTGGNFGQAPAKLYATLLEQTLELLCPRQTAQLPSALSASLRWLTDALIEFVRSEITTLVTTQSGKSITCKTAHHMIINSIAVHIRGLYPSTMSTTTTDTTALFVIFPIEDDVIQFGQQVLTIIQDHLSEMTNKSTFRTMLLSCAMTGKFGGDSTESQPLSTSFLTTQLQYIQSLELVVFNLPHGSILLEALTILRLFKKQLQLEVTKTSMNISCLVTSRVELCLRRLVALMNSEPYKTNVFSGSVGQNYRQLIQNILLDNAGVYNISNTSDAIRKNNFVSKKSFELIDERALTTDFIPSLPSGARNGSLAALIDDSSSALPTAQLCSLFGTTSYACTAKPGTLENTTKASAVTFLEDDKTKDAGNTYGMFSMHGSDSYGPEYQVSDADIVALMDDVLEPHLEAMRGEKSKFETDNTTVTTAAAGDMSQCFSATTKLPKTKQPTSLSQLESLYISDSSLNVTSALRNKDELFTTLNDDDCLWSVVSGSADLLTVSAHTRPNVGETSITVVIRVVNSAGFKIPIFNLQLLVSNDETFLPNYGEDNSYTTAASGPILNIGYPNSQYVTFGAEYFLPGAMLERSFVLRLQRLGSLSCTVRIAYPDTPVETQSDSILTASQAVTTTTSTATVGSNIPDPATLVNDLSNRTSFSSRPNTTANTTTHTTTSTCTCTAKINCETLRIPVCFFLIPYGGGVLSSMRSLQRTTNSPLVGIPKSVFLSLWYRLPHGTVFPCYSSSTSTSLADDVIMAISKSNCMYGSPIIPLSALMADSTSSTSRRDTDARKSTSIMDGNTLSWALQSWWGHEVAVRIVMSPSKKRGNVCDNVVESFISGRVEVRVCTKNILSKLIPDMAEFLFMLTDGIVALGDTGDGLFLIDK